MRRWRKAPQRLSRLCDARWRRGRSRRRRQPCPRRSGSATSGRRSVDCGRPCRPEPMTVQSVFARRAEGDQERVISFFIDRRKDFGDRPADRLGTVPARHLLGRGIEEGDPAVGVRGHDAIAHAGQHPLVPDTPFVLARLGAPPRGDERSHERRSTKEEDRADAPLSERNADIRGADEVLNHEGDRRGEEAGAEAARPGGDDHGGKEKRRDGRSCPRQGDQVDQRCHRQGEQRQPVTEARPSRALHHRASSMITGRSWHGGRAGRARTE